MTIKAFFLFLLSVASAYAAEVKVSDLISKLRSGNAPERRTACEALAQLGDKGAAAKPALRQALADPEVTVRTSAAIALGAVGSPDSQTIKSLIQATGDADWGVRHNAAQVLQLAGPSAAPLLEEALRSEEKWQRFHAADLLVCIDKAKTPLALPYILAGLKSEDAEMLGRAANTVSRLGADASDAIPILIERAANPAMPIRTPVIATLGALGPIASRAVPTLLEILGTEKDNAIRTLVYGALGSIGQPADRMIPVLIKGLSEKKDEPRIASGDALAKLGTAAVPALVSALDVPDYRLGALDGLSKMGPAAKPAVPELLKLLNDQDWIVRLRAASALGSTGESNEKVVQALNKAAQDEHESVRAHAATALVRLRNKSRG
jgi:HEAT repeat protein